MRGLKFRDLNTMPEVVLLVTWGKGEVMEEAYEI